MAPACSSSINRCNSSCWPSVERLGPPAARLLPAVSALGTAPPSYGLCERCLPRTTAFLELRGQLLAVQRLTETEASVVLDFVERRARVDGLGDEMIERYAEALRILAEHDR